jgi:hypothetical protein
MKPTPSAKRARMDAEDVPNFAFVTCMDDCDRLIEVDTRLLASFNCRLYGVIKHDRPLTDAASGRLHWRCGMTMAMLQTFVRSLQHGQLSLSKNVSVAEALTTFEFENVAIGAHQERQGDVAMLRMPPTGPVFEKRAERVHEAIVRVSEQIAHAIARWPRLECSLDSALSGNPILCTCTASRAWVRFCRKPQMGHEKGDVALQLARKWPCWTQLMLMAFGIVHSRLVRDKVVALEARDEKSFHALESAVHGDPLGGFMTTPVDWPLHVMDRAARRDHHAGETFSSGLRQAILEASVRDPSREGEALSSAVQDQKHAYARACMSLSEQLLQEAPSPASVYHGQCVDENGKSAERAQLQRSLAQRGIKVVRWNDDDKTGPARPLIFPPNWIEGAASGTTSCVLLEFSDRR